MKSETMVPFVKWVGGKRQLVPELKKRMPKHYKTYFEPFVGGGALFFALKPARAVINDIYPELMTSYKMVKQRWKALFEYLKVLEIAHNSDYKNFYYAIRSEKPSAIKNMPIKPSQLFAATRFIYLNKACFNGLYRVNQDGDFNVPNGNRRNLVTASFENFKRIASYLKVNDVQIYNRSYENVCAWAQKNDFVYLDPPYDYENGVNGFKSFHQNGFDQSEQRKLAKVCYDLNHRGVKFMLSNHNTTLVRELYKDFKIDVIKAKRFVGGASSRRKPAEEVVVRNYE